MSNVLQKQAGVGSAIAITANTETLLAYSGSVKINFPTMRLIIKGWLQLVIAAGTTGLILRIRRGNGVSGAVVAGGNTQTVTASTTDDFKIEFTETLSAVDFADYSLTMQTVAAGANHTANLALITAEAING